MDALDKRFSAALEASAGTGKTFQLSMRVASMLMSGVPPQDILCLTFTNKATDEMLERIVKVLDAAAEGSAPESERAVLENAMKKRALLQKKEYTGDYLKNSARAARDRLLADFSSLKVKTIDAFSNLILKIFPFEAELRPDYGICTEDEEKELLEEAFYITLSRLLEERQWRLVLEKVSEALEIGPSSLTETLQKYAAFSAAKNIELKNQMKSSVLTPEEIGRLLDKAAGLKEKAVEAALAFAGEIFDPDDTNKNRAKVYANLKAISDTDKITGMKIFQGPPEEHAYFKKYDFTETQRLYHDRTRELTRKYLSAKGEAAKALSLSIGRLLYGNLKKLKNDKNILTYSDIGERAYEMLVTDKPHIDKDYLYFRLDGRINHILIDEFQDTSSVQWLILKPLAEEAMAGIGQMDKEGSFFYVGDPKQNLYRFRGGSSGLFREVAESYEGRLFKSTLPINYRSGANIVEFVNSVFRTAAGKFRRKELEIFDIDQKPRPGCPEGCAEIRFFHEGEDYKAFTLSQVRRAEENGWRYGDMAVLVPSNKDGAEIKFALASEAIPVRLETSRSLADTGIFRTVKALAIFLETGEAFPFLEYAFTEKPALTGAKYAEESMRAAVMKAIEASAGDGGLTIFERLINAAKYTGLQSRFKGEPDFAQTMDVIAQAAPDEKNIASFLEAVIKAASSRPSVTAENEDAVTVMTIHKSKGLQFPLVILPKLDIELETSVKGDPFIIKRGGAPGGAEPAGTLEFIHKKNAKPFLEQEGKDALEEENALVLQDALNRLYVAMTRAERALITGLAPAPKSAGADPSTIERLLPELTEVPFAAGSIEAPHTEKKNAGKKATAQVKAEFYVTGEKKELPEEETVSFKAAITGTIFHRAAFLLEGFTDEAAETALEQALSCDGALIGEEERSEIESYLKSLVKSEEWKELFKGSVFRERKTGADGALYSIDFYSVFSDKIVLIDYKTGEISAEQEKAYTEQLEKYAEILEGIYNLPVSKYIYHFRKSGLNIKKAGAY